VQAVEDRHDRGVGELALSRELLEHVTHAKLLVGRPQDVHDLQLQLTQPEHRTSNPRQFR
jgi:hypothetical protein